jgi:signal peptidase II
MARLKDDLPFILVVVSVLVLDQLTKFWIDENLPLHTSIPIIPGFFHLTYIRNPGAAFGILAQLSAPLRSLFFLTVAAAALWLILYYLHYYPRRPIIFTYSLAFIFAGACGNMMDRIRLGEVIDFFDFFIGEAHWPAFNVADASITVGAVLLFWILVKNPPKRKAGF